jgi:hypothetical protein
MYQRRLRVPATGVTRDPMALDIATRGYCRAFILFSSLIEGVSIRLYTIIARGLRGIDKARASEIWRIVKTLMGDADSRNLRLYPDRNTAIPNLFFRQRIHAFQQRHSAAAHEDTLASHIRIKISDILRRRRNARCADLFCGAFVYVFNSPERRIRPAILRRP